MFAARDRGFKNPFSHVQSSGFQFSWKHELLSSPLLNLYFLYEGAMNSKVQPRERGAIFLAYCGNSQMAMQFLFLPAATT